MNIPAAFLLAPGTGNTGKFYIAILDDRCPITLHGPNKPTTAGTKTDVRNADGARKKVREKRGEYSDVMPNQISKAARDHAVTLICSKIPGLDPTTARFEQGGIVFGAAGAGPSAPRQRPKSTGKKLQHTWF